jgi:hypothetical protein
MSNMQNNINKLIKPLALAILLMAAANAVAQPEVEATIAPKEILIGQPTTLTLQVNHEPNVTIFWPNTDVELPIDSGRVLEVLNKSKIDTVLTGGFMQQKLTLQVTAWDTGFYIIPPFKFLYQSPADTAPLTLENYPVLLQVNTIVVDTTQAFKGLKDPIDAPFSIWEYKYHILGGAVALFLIAFLFYIMFRRVDMAAKTAAKPKKPAHEMALEKLMTIEGAKLWQQGDLKTYYSGISDTMREYLEARFRFLAVESTTDEIFSELDKLDLPAKQRDQLKEMFTLADLAKFAKVQPLPDDHLNAMRIAKEFVNQTHKTKPDSTHV